MSQRLYNSHIFMLHLSKLRQEINDLSKSVLLFKQFMV